MPIVTRNQANQAGIIVPALTWGQHQQQHQPHIPHPTTGNQQGIMPPAAVPPALQAILQCFDVCGATEAQKQAMVKEGYSSLEEFSLQTPEQLEKQISNLPKKWGGLTRAQQEAVNIGGPLTMKFMGLSYWCRRQISRGQALDADLFTAQVMYRCLDEMRLESGKKKMTETATLPKGKFEPKDWIAWSDKFLAYLGQVEGANNLSLSYVVRKPKKPGEAFESEEEEAMYSAALEGIEFKKDNATVCRLLVQLLADSTANNWIKKYTSKLDGRGAWLAMVKHYDGPHEVRNRIEIANSTLKNTWYTNEKTLPWEKFVSKLQGAFDTLEKHKVPWYEDNKVRHLREHIRSDNFALRATMNQIQRDPNMSKDFIKATDLLGECIAEENRPLDYSKEGKPPARNISATESAKQGTGRGGRGRGRGRGRGGRGGGGRGSGNSNSDSVKDQNGKKFNNGVDISNLGRSYTNTEWRQLGPGVQANIRKARTGQDSGGSKRDVASASIANFDLEEDSEDQPAHNGSSFGSGAYTLGGTKKKAKRNASEIKTGVRVLSSAKSATMIENPVAGTLGRLELDSHADTCCFGANFTTMFITQYVCDVSPFSNEYTPMKDVPICSAATAYDDKTTGETTILVFHQGLWFGPSLANSLINPNQCRHFGITIQEYLIRISHCK